VGDLDEIILWNAALTATEINSVKSRRVTPAADSRIIGLWHFDEKSGASAADSSGHGHNAALLNGTSWINSTVP
jgi:hypothetical protein